MCKDVLPFSDQSYTLGCVQVPLHNVYLKSDLVTGAVELGVRPKLPVDRVSIIFGNDLAGANVFPCPVVANRPDACPQSDLSAQFPTVFPACVVTRPQLKKFNNVIDISDYLLGADSEPRKKKLGCGR